jgi:uncharacterized protein
MEQDRTYRNFIRHETLCSFQVMVKETDVHIHADHRLESVARELILKYRGQIEAYIHRHSEFLGTLAPWPLNDPAPSIVREMIEAGRKAHVGPMAAVAGAVAQYVGRDLLAYTDQVIVENGGDIFLKTNSETVVAVYAGRSVLSMRIGLRIDSKKKPLSICTSSGTVGHSLSFGSADAVCVVSESCPLADAAATAIGNQLHSQADIQRAVNMGKCIEGVKGIFVIMGGQVGLWGDVSLVSMTEKKVEF